MNLTPPPSALTDVELGRLEMVALPAEPGWEPETVYRFKDTGEFVVESDKTARAIRAAFPGAQIRRV
jgi:hypothetical protein